MAKATKKSSKKQVKKTKLTAPKSSLEKVPASPIDPGMVSFAMSESDMLTFANLMAICAKTFESLALDAAEKDNVDSFNQLKARWQLSTVFAGKLADCIKMPEPISRDFH